MDNYLITKLKKVPLEELQLSIRSHNALRRAGMISVFDVWEAVDFNRIRDVYNIGEKSLEEIINKLENFILIYSDADSNTKQLSFNQSANKQPNINTDEVFLPNIQWIVEVPINLLANYLGERTMENLLSIGIDDVGKLNNLMKGYLEFLQPAYKLLDKTIHLLDVKIRHLLDLGNLSPAIKIDSTSLIEYLNTKPENEALSKEKFYVLNSIVGEKSLTYQMQTLKDCLSDRQRQFFIEYNLDRLTLEEIALKQEEPITRERVRQVISEARNKMKTKLDNSLKVYISSALEAAKELGSSLSKESWRSRLLEKEILINDKLDQDNFDFFCALIKDKKTSQSIYGVTNDIKKILYIKEPRPLFVINALTNIPKENFRKIKRAVVFTGGISKAQAGQLLGCKHEETAEILKEINLCEIIPGWFSLSEKLQSGWMPIFRGGLIMIQSCGPLEFDSFCDGLRRYISRHFDAIAPPEVILHMLLLIGFKVENNIVSFTGEQRVELGRSDKAILELLDKKGPVLSYQEIVEHILSKGFSFPTATSRIMPGSPIIEKIEQGIYKLRGYNETWHDIESVKARQEEFTRSAEISYGLDGIIRYRVNVGVWEIGGVLSVSRSCQQLPDLGEGWPVYVADKKVGVATRDDSLIWGLSPAFNEIGIKLGDRVELAFITWNEQKIEVRLIKE
jgi:Bacterial RNA polymerase, alpha chain C terminal domain./Sigma-70, region 4.